MLAGTLIILLIRLLISLLSGKTIKSGNRTKLLGGNIITLTLTFYYPVERICKKASEKLCALIRVTKYMAFSKGELDTSHL